MLIACVCIVCAWVALCEWEGGIIRIAWVCADGD